jgi:hypothetical protein
MLGQVATDPFRAGEPGERTVAGRCLEEGAGGVGQADDRVMIQCLALARVLVLLAYCGVHISTAARGRTA